MALEPGMVTFESAQIGVAAYVGKKRSGRTAVRRTRPVERWSMTSYVY